MCNIWLPKKLRALAWALLACVGEAAAGGSTSTQVRLFYAMDSLELHNLVDGLKKSGHTAVTLSSTLDSQACNAPGQVITFGGDATEAYTKLCPQKPVTFVASSYAYGQLKDHLTKDSWGYYLDQPPAKQIEHADRNIPSIKTIGILYNDNDGDLDKIKALAKANYRIQIKLVKVESDQIIAQVLRSLYEQVDAVLVTSNSEIWPLQDFKTYLLLGMRQNKVMIGGHNQFYTNRGVLSAINTDFTALGEQLSKDLGETNHPRVRYFDKTVIVTNQMLAARYGIYIGDKSE